MCAHKDTRNDEVYEIHYGCSRFLPPTPERDCVVFSVERVFGGPRPGMILIKCIFISAILICMAHAIRVRERRNEQGENE